MRFPAIAFVALAACAAPRSPTCPEAAAASPVARHRPLTIATRYCDVEHTAGARADARVLAAIVDRATLAIETELPFARVAFSGVACRVHQHGIGDPLASDGHSGSYRFDEGGEYSVDMHFLALSKHSPVAMTSAGQPMDADYLAKIVYADFASLALDRGMRQKQTGYRYGDAPEWFRAGYAEYLAVTLSSVRYKTTVLRRYIAAVRDDPARIGFGVKIEVKRRWNEGAVLIAFLTDSYGKKKLVDLSMSDRPTFESAFRATFGVDVDAIEPAFAAWLAKQ